MKRIKYYIIWFLDWIIDVRILRHSIPKYCNWLADHPWWEGNPHARPPRPAV